ncbi:MAG: serpin family protein [Longimicrobiales bacterium]
MLAKRFGRQIRKQGSRAACLALGAGLLACDGPLDPGDSDRIDQLPRALSANEQAVIVRSNGFGLELLKEVVAADPRPNIVISSLSASMALGMTLNGAVDSTFTAMGTTLGFEGMAQADINAAYSGLIELLSGLDPTVTFEIANAIWANQNYTFHQDFFDDVSGAFDARVESSDFSNGATLGEINGWVDDKTSGKIESILDQLDPDLVMLLLNAIYFDGAWTTQFDPDDTQPGSFTRPDDSQVTVDMMHMADEEFSLGGGAGYASAELPYGGEAFSMIYLVPDDGDARALVATLDDTKWAEITGSLTVQEVDQLSIPKMTLTYDVFLNEMLADMGMDVAFTPGADFSGMSPQGDSFCIDFVRQKTFLEVDEAGTRAAAVTAVGIGPTSFTGLIVDRPFVFAIRERLSGTILFTGVVEDPTAAAEAPDDFVSRCG